MPAFRSAVALSDAITRDLMYRFRLAGVIGTGALLATWLLDGFLLFRGPPSLADAALGGLVFLIVALVAFAVPFVSSGRMRHALETVYWAASESARRWAEAFGDPRVPANPKQALAWLARHPEDTQETRGARVFVKLVIGDLVAARELVSRLPARSPADRLRRETSAAMVRLVEGGDPDVEGLTLMAEALPDEADRLHAHADMAILRGLLAAADGGDWTVPMLDLRERLGGRERGALRRLMWLPIAAMFVVAAVVITGAAFGLRALVGDTIGPA
jgi:hypothetical protein